MNPDLMLGMKLKTPHSENVVMTTNNMDATLTANVNGKQQFTRPSPFDTAKQFSMTSPTLLHCRDLHLAHNESSPLKSIQCPFSTAIVCALSFVGPYICAILSSPNGSMKHQQEAMHTLYSSWEPTPETHWQQNSSILFEVVISNEQLLNQKVT